MDRSEREVNKLSSGTLFGSEDEIKALGKVTGPLYHYTKHCDAVESLLAEDCKVNWDRKGIGSVPKQIDLHYFGFTKEMYAAEFQRLVPVGVSNSKTADDLRPKAEAGEAIAPPFLIVDWDEDAKMWQVVNHEGRSRSRLVCASDKIPVDIFPRHIRARHLTPEMLKASFIPQR